jgi:hypothetical protein
LPSDNRLHAELQARGFLALLVNLGEDAGRVRQAARERGYVAPVLLDAGRQLARHYNVVGTPTVYLVDRQGRLLGRAVGPSDWGSEAARRFIEKVLAM